MVKAVVFDLGKVLVDFDYGIAVRRLAGRCRMTAAGIGQFIGQSPLLLQYEIGALTSEHFFREICSHTGFAGDLEEFAAYFSDIFTPIAPMVHLHAALRQKKIPTYILSNTNELAIRHIRSAFPFFSDFNGYILSYEHGAMKPDPKLYEAVEHQCGFRGPEILYLDDRPENLVTATARGWKVILQETPDQTRAAMGELGLLNHEAERGE